MGQNIEKLPISIMHIGWDFLYQELYITQGSAYILWIISALVTKMLVLLGSIRNKEHRQNHGRGLQAGMGMKNTLLLDKL